MRRQEGTTGRYIQIYKQLQKPKVVTRSNTYAARLREGKKNLIIGDSHIIRVKKDKLKN